jgi:muramoyltetrapeptide carboxypeptidase LdcA involved in peptidoglycan recycling
MVTQLRQTGLLAKASAVVVGELPQCDEPSGGEAVGLTGRAAIADVLRDFGGPVVIGFPSGHTIGPAMTLPFGVRCRVVADSRPRLIIEEAAVE